MSKVWLITDAAQSLGRTLAEAVLRAGGRVVAGARDPARLAVLEARHGARVRTVELDAAAEATLYAAVDEALTAFGRIDVVVNSIGQVDEAAHADMADTHLRAQFEANVFGLAAVAHAVLPILREQRAGRFVQILAHDDGAGSPAGRAAHAALTSYFEALGREVARDGVDIDVVDAAAMLAETVGGAASKARKAGSGDSAGAGRATTSGPRVMNFPARPEAA